MDFSFAGVDGLQRRQHGGADLQQQQAGGPAEGGDAAGRASPPAVSPAAASPASPGIAIPSFRDVQQAEKRRTMLPNVFKPGGIGSGPALAAAATSAHRSGLEQQQQVNPFSFIGGPATGAGGAAPQPQRQHWQQSQPGPLQPASGAGNYALPQGGPRWQQQLESCRPPAPQQPSVQRRHQPAPRHLGNVRPSLQHHSQPQHLGAQPVRPPLQQPRPQQEQQLPQNAIVVSKRQKGNRVLECIRNVRWQYADIVPDFLLGRDTACLFLSLRYHLLKPEYIHQRIKELQRSYRLRIIMCHVDTEDAVEPLAQVTRAAIGNECTLVCGWSTEECARYLETFKSYEHKPAEVIQKDLGTDYLSRINSVLTTVRGVNKTDVKTLGDRFESVGAIFKASAEELQTCAGIGPTKARRLHDTFCQPFRRSASTIGHGQQANAGAGDQEHAAAVQDPAGAAQAAVELWHVGAGPAFAEDDVGSEAAP